MLRNLMILVCLICTTTTFAQKPPKNTEKKDDVLIDYKKVGAPMPPIKILLYHDSLKKDNTQPMYMTDQDLDNRGNLLVMMFNPTCSHCQDETAVLEKNIFLFKKTELVFLANPVMKAYLPDYVNMLHVAEYPSIHVGIDSSDFINKVFLFQSLPQINIYDKHRKLLKIYNGEVAIDSLKQYIQ